MDAFELNEVHLLIQSVFLSNQCLPIGLLQVQLDRCSDLDYYAHGHRKRIIPLNLGGDISAQIGPNLRVSVVSQAIVCFAVQRNPKNVLKVDYLHLKVIRQSLVCLWLL